jgi:regulator of protease activity HflC (stomatin/prohibitin superfamily)
MEFIVSLFPFALVLVFTGLRVIDQYERGVVLTLGKYSGTREPGLTWILPGVQSLTKVDMRIRTLDIPQQEVITKDNVSVTINAVVYFKVTSAEDSVLKIQNYSTAIAQYAQTALRDVIGGIELDTLLAERAKISEEIEKIVDATTAPWGVDVSDIRIQDIQLDQNMRRVMAQQAEAERDRRATIIRAEGELMAAEKLAQAATIFAKAPGGIQLRTLQTIEMAAAEQNKTIVFALPTDIMHRAPEFTSAINS